MLGLRRVAFHCLVGVAMANHRYQPSQQANVCVFDTFSKFAEGSATRK